MRELAAVLKDFPGESPVLVQLMKSDGPHTLQLGPAYGQAMQTYVSDTGKDGNPCTSGNPCRTL